MPTNRVDHSAPEVKVRVLAKHIAEGVRNDSRHCAIVRAIEDQMNATRVRVDATRVAFTVGAERMVYMQSPTGQNLIRTFDNGGKPKPCTLRLKFGVVMPSGTQGSRMTKRFRRQESRKRRAVGYKPMTDRLRLRKSRVNGFEVITYGK